MHVYFGVTRELYKLAINLNLLIQIDINKILRLSENKKNL